MMIFHVLIEGKRENKPQIKKELCIYKKPNKKLSKTYFLRISFSLNIFVTVKTLVIEALSYFTRCKNINSPGVGQPVKISFYICLYIYKFGQNIVEKYFKLSRIGFPVKGFRGEFYKFSSLIIKTFILGSQLGRCL